MCVLTGHCLSCSVAHMSKETAPERLVGLYKSVTAEGQEHSPGPPTPFNSPRRKTAQENKCEKTQEKQKEMEQNRLSENRRENSRKIEADRDREREKVRERESRRE